MLRTIVTTVALVTVFAPSAQAVEFVNKDNSAYGQLCITAVESREALAKEADLQKLTNFEIREIRCNDMSIESFARKYRAVVTTETAQAFDFENTNQANESELCIAAATSNAAFNETKTRLFANTHVSNVSCNGKPLASFAKRYNKKFNG